MTTRKLNSHAIAKSASTYIGNAGEIFYDTATATLRLSDGSTTGGITFSGGAPASSLVNGASNVSIATANEATTITRGATTYGPGQYAPPVTWTFGSGPIKTALTVPGYVQGSTGQTGFINSVNLGMDLNGTDYMSLGINDGGANVTKLYWGSASKNGILGDVEIQTINSGGTPTSIILSPQGGVNGSFVFDGTGNLSLPTGGRLTADNIDVVNLNVSNLNLISPTNYLWLSLYQYYSGSLLTSTFGSISGTAVGTTHPVTQLVQLSTSGRGSGAVFQVNIVNNGQSGYGLVISYSTVLIDYNGGNQQYGTGYAVGDTVTIAGADLGGTTPANNLTFTIGNAVKNNYPAGLEGGMIYDYSTKHFMVYNGSTWTQLDNPLTPNGTKASNAYGVAGQTSYDADYFYTCIATNTWRRVALGSTY